MPRVRAEYSRMFSDRLSDRDLADWSRTVSTSLRAGIPTLQALRKASNQGSPRLRRVSGSMAASLESGEDIDGAIDHNKRYFPPLLVNMAKVGAQTGHLPEVLRELETYYRYQLSLRRKLLQQITWPAFQLGMAIFVIALVIYLLGMLPAGDILGLGLSGSSGALIWLSLWGVAGATVYVGYRLLRERLGQAEVIDRFFLSIPVLGPTLRTLALGRVAMAMHLTQESGMSLRRALPLALDASGNAVFAGLSGPILESIRGGRGLADSFREHSVFPAEFVDVLANAEDAGRIPEAMQRLSVEYAERSEHQLALLNQAAGWIVWVLVAAIIIFFIFNIAINGYFGPMNDMMNKLEQGRF